MWDKPPQGREGLAWLAVAAWAACIFLTVPLARRIEGVVVEHLGRDAFLWGVLAVGAAALGFVLVRLRRARALRGSQLAWLVGVAAVYAAASFSLRRNAEEAVHFVQYGILGVLAVRALGHRTRDASVYVAAALVGGNVGLLDEGLQWLVPGRVWDLRDVGLNLAGAALVQPALAFGVAPGWVERRFRPRGLRGVARLGALGWLLLGASLLNTPARIGALAELPGLGFLRESGDMMLEYGHLHEDPEVGAFRSRFRLDELARLDAERGAAAGRRLAEWADRPYDEFLRVHSPITDPFLHEARVHLFVRDRYLGAADDNAAEGDLDQAQREWTVAWRENRLLERHFPRTLAHSGQALVPAVRARLAASQLAERPYTSRVSRELVTEIGEAQVAAVWGLGLGGWLTAAWMAGRASRD